MIANVHDTAADRAGEPLVTDELYLVKVDEERLREKLARWRGGCAADVTREQVHGWLGNIGFLRLDCVWICEPETLCVLEPAEVQAICRWPAARHGESGRDTDAAA